MQALLESHPGEPAPNVAAPPAQFNFASHLFRLNDVRPDKPAYIDDAGVTTYAQLEDRARFSGRSMRASYLWSRTRC
jgi:benzoate-CoA ligase